MPQIKLSQHDRLFKIDTPFGDDKVVVRHFHGKESISGLSQYTVELVSADFNLDPDAIIGKVVKLAICQSDDKTYRYFNGVCSRFSQGVSEGPVAIYQMEIVPWLWFLTQTQDCYIHQELPVDKIVKWVFDKFQFRDYEFQLRMQHDPWEYCTQYRESAFAFVSRLMEAEGMFYFWKQVEGRHLMMIGDGAHANQPCPYQARYKMEKAFGRGFKRLEDSIFTLEAKSQFKTGKYTYREYNFLTPDSELQGETNARVGKRGKDKFEIYDYPGEYEAHGEANPFTRLRMEESEVDEDVMEGTSCARSLLPGYKIDISGHDRRDYNKNYIVTHVQHEGHEENYLMEEEAKPPSYKNSFSCVPSDVPYRPERKTPKHIMRGVQTAVVVGPKGEEIYPDKYGRVKVQFQWDRVGKKDENSSCWIRVAQLWAGKNFGAMFLPRIGQEVIVDFVEGDPDRPIITGRVYNAANMPPYELPKNKNWSGIKSRSTKSGSPDNFNEIRFDDTKGQELFWMHAEKDMRITVENDTDEIVDRDRKLRVKRDQIEQIEGEKHVQVDKNEFRKVQGNQDEQVQGNHSEKVAGNRDITIGGNFTAKIGGSIGLTFDATVGAKVSGGLSLNTSTGLTIKDDMNVVIESGMSLTLKSSGGFISITPAGIFINGTMLFLNSGGAPTPATPAMVMSPKAPDPPKNPAKFGGENPYVTQGPAKTSAIPPPPPQAKVSTPPPPPPPEAKFQGSAPIAFKEGIGLSEKVERTKKRAEFLKGAKANSPKVPADKKNAYDESVKRLERNNHAVEMAKISQAVYDPSGAPEGWKRVAPEDMPPGLKNQTWTDPQTGFRAALFQSETPDENGKKPMVLAFRGTKEGQDWTKANVPQGAGMGSSYYTNAVRLAQAMDDTYGENFETAGHSLGGGLAATAATVAGVKGNTFNAAGVHENTLKEVGMTPKQADGKVDNFRVQGELLTGLQENVVSKYVVPVLGTAIVGPIKNAIGLAKGLSPAAWYRYARGQGPMPKPELSAASVYVPSAIGSQHDIPALDAAGNPVKLTSDPIGLGRHGIDYCIRGLEMQKYADFLAISEQMR